MMDICWLGHSSFRIEVSGKVVYIDPYLVEDGKKADLILITHGHYDHCDPGSISNISKDDTVILTAADCKSKIRGNVKSLTAGNSVELKGLIVSAVHAYNTNKPNHPKGSGIGFIVEAEGKRIYHAGDTDLISEMKHLRDITLALLPVGGSFTMDWQEAADAVRLIRPEIAIPMHYGPVVGSRDDALNFKKKAESNTKTRIEVPEEGEAVTI